MLTESQKFGITESRNFGHAENSILFLKLNLSHFEIVQVMFSIPEPLYHTVHYYKNTVLVITRIKVGPQMTI